MPRILVIEDEKPQRLVVMTSLKQHGFEVIGAENGSEGLEIARTQLPDLILSDIHMEMVDGYSLLASIRNDPSTATIPLIFITGMADLQVMRQSMELGADDFLPKPFTTESLLAAINTRLLKQRRMVEQATKKLDELRATMSVTVPHEFRTPLNGILGYSDIMRKQYEDLEPVEVGRMAERIHKNGKRLERLIENYLLYAQTELKQTDLHKKGDLFESETPHPDQVIEQIATQKAQDFGRAGDLELELATGRVMVTPKYFTKIVDELLDNGFRFSKSGSHVIVTSDSIDNHFTFSISDQGRGMTPEQISQIGAFVQFERQFYEQQGQGLGLTVARRLVQLHGGTLTIMSEYGRGTTVTVSLP